MGPPSARKVREGRSEVRNQKMRRDQWGKIGARVESCQAEGTAIAKAGSRKELVPRGAGGRCWVLTECGGQ